MIPSVQLTAFRNECEKLGAHPYVHGATALAGGGLAAYGVAPYMFHQHERDVRDVHLGKMEKDVQRHRDRRRALQTLAAVLGGTALGGAAPLAVESGGRALKNKWNELRGGAGSAARDVGRQAAEGVADGLRNRASDIAQAAEQAGHAAAKGVADAVREQAGDIAEEAAKGVRRGGGGLFGFLKG